MRKVLIGAGVLLVIGIVAFLVFPLTGTGNAQSATTSTRTAQIERTTLYDSVEGAGSIAAEQEFQLSFGISGTVQEVLVEVGDEVTAGQTLAVMDTSDLELDVRLAELSLTVQQANYDGLVAGPTEQEIAQAEEQLIQAQTQLESAQADLESADDELLNSCSGVATAHRNLEDAQTVYDDYTMSGYEQDPNFAPDPDAPETTTLADAQSSYDRAAAQCNIATRSDQSARQVETAQLNLEQVQFSYDELRAGPDEDEVVSAEAQLLQAEIQLAQAQENLADAQITAPFDGVITEVSIVNGQAVNASTVVMIIADMSLLHVNVSVDELDVVDVEEGQSAQITVEAFDDTTIAGTVRTISPAGSTTQGLVTYNVRVDLSTTAVSSADDGAQTPVDTAAQEAPSGGTGVVPGQTDNSDTAATEGQPAANDGTGMVPPQPGAAAGGSMGFLRQIMPVIMQLGGAQALEELLAQENGEEQFYTQLSEAGIAEDVIAQVRENGGPLALVETLSQFGGPGQGGPAGAAPAGTTQDNGTTSGATESTVGQSPAANQTANEGQSTSATDEALPIRLGMTADVEVIVNMQENVLVVPTSAIQREGEENYLLVDDGSGGQTRVTVTVGDTDSGMTVISGNVTEGQTVYIPVSEDSSSSTSSLRPGAGMGSLLGGGGGGAPPAGAGGQ